LDATNSSNLLLLGSSSPFNDNVQDIAISGHTAYVAAGAAGVGVIDISNPAVPATVGVLDTRGYAEGIAVAGTTIYLADGPDGLRIINAANPAGLLEVGSAFPFNYAFDVAVAGRYAYVAAGGGGLLIADVSNPFSPIEIASYDTPGYAYGLTLIGTTVYVADGWGGIHAVDASNPALPIQKSSYSTPGWALNVTAVGTTLYVANGANGVRLLDATNSSAIREVGAYTGSGFARRVAAGGSAVYVADTVQGVQIVNANIIAQPSLIGQYVGIVEARWVAVAGSYAYVGGGKSGDLIIVDITDANNPRQVGVFQAEGYISSVMINGNYAYLASYESTPNYLWAVDITDPAHPILAGTFPVSSLEPIYGAAREAVLRGGYIYVADEYGLRIFDVGDPTNIRKVGTIQLNENNQEKDTLGVAVSGNYAYVAGAMGGVRIVDVSTPTAPRLVSTFSTSGNCFSVAAEAGRLYAGSGDGTIQVVSVADPARPVAVGSYSSQGPVYGLSVVGNQLFVSNGGGGIQVLDISNPAAVSLQTFIETPGEARQLVSSGDLLYVANGSGGVAIYRSQAGNGTMTPRAYSSQSSGKWLWPSASRSSSTTVCTVASTADSGAGSLRECLTNAIAGLQINFAASVFPPDNPAVIYLQSPLPTLAAGSVTLDAGNAGVVIDGGHSVENGIKIASASNRIMGLHIANFSGDGLLIDYPSQYNQIGGDRFVGNGPSGQGNVFTGNRNGMRILSASHNTVTGNMIGTDASGTMAMGNEWGVMVSSDAFFHRLGGLSPGERNIVSGNTRTGIDLMESSAWNVVVGNYIGTDITGTVAIPNGSGVVIEVGATNNVVGGTTAGERNIISGNTLRGVTLSDSRSVQNSIIGNYIGTDVSGMAALPNGDGILVWGAGFNRIGGSLPGEGNLISGNRYPGVVINGLTPKDIAIVGNSIGVDASGNLAIGNGSHGILITDGVQHNFIGGTGPAEMNIVRGSPVGIEVASVGTKYNSIAGNLVGNNSSAGIYIHDHAASNFVFRNSVVNNAVGIRVSASAFNALRGNGVASNASAGIDLDDDGNQMVPPPVIAYGNERNVWGSSCAECIVDIFSDANDEGATFEGSVMADVAGAFAFPGTETLTGPKITATATDRSGNTSEFSVPYLDNTVPPYVTQADCLFDWAERAYPDFFAPGGATSHILLSYYYRHYSLTNAYLGMSSLDSRLYFLGPQSGNSLIDVGSLSTWLATAGCQ
jgi:hypothetical protein